MPTFGFADDGTMLRQLALERTRICQPLESLDLSTMS
jgi:hypothetical protein